jgi:zinc transporter ZupT
MPWKTILLAVSLGALLVLSLWGIGPQFAKHAANISLHGWIALTLGVVLSLGLGGGLMALSFYSSRRGYDDRVEWEEPHEEE